MSAIGHQSKTCSAQKKVGTLPASDQQVKRTNEIKSAIQLLDAIDIEGKEITADALLTQRKIADYTENSCAGALRNFNKFTVVRPPKKIDNFRKERYASMMFAFKGDAAITYRYVICLLIFLSYVLVFFHRLCPAVIALDIQSSFGISGTLLGVLGSAYFYSYAIMQLPTGLMADSWGPRKTVSVFLLLAGIGSIVMGIAPNLAVAVTGRILVGIGVSTVFVCNFKLLSEWFTPRLFIIMGSAFMSMGGIGALSSSTPLAWVSNAIGWRMTFLSVGIITLLMAALVYAFVRNRPSEMGLSPINPNWEETHKGIGLLSGMKMVVTSGRFWPPAIWAFCVIGISFAIGGLWGGPYLMQVYGHSKTSAGGVLSTFALALIFGSPISGWFANRLGRKSVLIGASVMLMMVSGIMGLYVDAMTLPALYVLFFFLFFSGGAIGPVIATIAKELFPIAISGTAVGAINLFPFAGAALFQVLIGAVLTARGLGQAQYTAVGFRYMFLICLTGGIISLAAAFMMKETLQYREGS